MNKGCFTRKGRGVGGVLSRMAFEIHDQRLVAIVPLVTTDILPYRQ
jgi:hypothetical protein